MEAVKDPLREAVAPPPSVEDPLRKAEAPPQSAKDPLHKAPLPKAKDPLRERADRHQEIIALQQEALASLKGGADHP